MDAQIHIGKIFIIFIVFIAPIKGSHFRGGLITWKPINDTAIGISYRISWRLTASVNHFCNSTTISSGKLNTGEGKLICTCSTSPILSLMSYRCTDFSASEDWITGVNTVSLDISNEEETFHAGFSDSDWIELQEGGSKWSVMALINVTQRNERGVLKINSSPTTAMQPVTRLEAGCNYVIRVPVNDVNGDVVRCRWADKSQFGVDECGGVCRSLSGSILSEETCELTYKARDEGYYAVAIQIEDFLSSSDKTPLSSVPLQFLVLVSSTNSPCSSGPTFTGNTLADGTRIEVVYSSNFTMQIVVESSQRIAEIITVSPTNMKKGDLSPYGTSGNSWSVNVSWTPSTPSEVGEHFFCFSAVDTNGLSSEQRCVTLIVLGSCHPHLAKSTSMVTIVVL